MSIITLQSLPVIRDLWQTSEERARNNVSITFVLVLFETTLQDVLWMMSGTSFYKTVC